MRKKIYFTSLILLLASFMYSQNIELEKKAINATVTQIYDLLSGTAGERDWEAFKQLFHSTAMMGATIVDKDGNRVFYSFTPEQYILNNDAFLKKNDFYEEELGNKMQIFGGLAQVYSAFQYRFSKEGKVEARGVNCIQLIKEKGRWWITNLVWEDESEQNKIQVEPLKQEKN